MHISCSVLVHGIEGKIATLLLPEDSELIQQIRLSKYNQHDRYVWPYTTNIEYTVKSGYWTATQDFYEGENIDQPVGSISLKRMIWKLDILPKIQHFLWRTLSGALPPPMFNFALVELIQIQFARDAVLMKKLSTICYFCYKETINHMLIYKCCSKKKKSY